MIISLNEQICGVYVITNINNNKLYIGSSVDIHRRWKQHKRDLMNNKHHSSHLQSAYNKYGSNVFKYQILELCNEEDLYSVEQFYMDYFKSYNDNNGYNISSLASHPDRELTSISVRGENNWCTIYTENQIMALIDDLKMGEMSYRDLSQKHNISYDIVASVASHSSWKYLSEGVVFPSPKISSRKNVVLIENDVRNIVEMMLNGKCNKEISELYNVHAHTISDIRNHRTWNSLTNDIVFNKSPKERAFIDKKRDKQSKIITYKEKGLSQKEIANKLGMSCSWVSALLRENH